MVFPSAYEVEIQRFANALYNLQVGSTTMSQVQSDIATLGGVDATLNYYFNYINGAQSNAQVAETLLANFGVVAGQYGLDAVTVGYARDYIVGALAAVPADQRGAAVADIAAAFASLSGDATYGAAATAWNAEVTAAIAYTGVEDAAAGSVVDFFRLSADRDIITGTAGDDVFDADVLQVGGPQVNALGTGDILTGGAGEDLLNAQVTNGLYMGSGNMPIMPETVGIEEVQLQAIFSDLSGYQSDDVFFSAKNMPNIDVIGSDHSDADLIIQDLTVDANELTSSMTVTMAYTGNADHQWDASDLAVYFDEDDLLAGTDANPGAVYYWILDEIAWDVVTGFYVPAADSPYRDPGGTLPVGDDLLWRIDRNGVSFNLEGVPYEVVIGNLVPTQDYRDANDHATYVQYLNTELNAMKAANPELNGLSFSLDASIVRTTQTDFDQTAIVPAIVLVDADARLLTNPEISRDRGATGYFDVFGDVSDVPPTPIDLLISVDVELEKVGRGGDGGELVIGGMNKGAGNIWGEGSSLKPAGVEQFDVTVFGGDLLPNSLAALKSTNNALQVVNIDSAAGVTAADAADLIIGNSNTNGTLGTLLGNAQALKDVQILDASGFVGDLTVYAALTNEVVAKYMDLQDTQAAPADDNAEFFYTLGQANDHLNLVISADNLDAAGTTTREDFELTVDGGTGNDRIEFMIGNGEGIETTAWYINSNLNNTNDQTGDNNPRAYIEISGGAGDDTIVTYGAGDLVINGNAGSDTIYTENSGAFAKWVFNADDATLGAMVSDVNDAYATLTDSLVDTDTLYTATVTVTFKGLTSTVTFSSTDATFTDLELNQALKAAINDNGVLNKLLVASDGPANILIVDSLIDGVTVDELSFAVTNEAAGVVTPLVATYAVAFTAGTDGLCASDNEITPGTGTSDVVVLGTYAGDEDNVIYDEVNSGRDTIVNFLVNVDASGLALAGNDTLDFTPLTGAAATEFGLGTLTGAFSAIDGSVTLVTETLANDTAAEIKALFDANAAEDASVTEHIYIAVTGDAAVANAWLIQDGALANDSVVTIIGTIDLADVAWSTLTAANFV